jgi:hypothetical protein
MNNATSTTAARRRMAAVMAVCVWIVSVMARSPTKAAMVAPAATSASTSQI